MECKQGQQKIIEECDFHFFGLASMPSMFDMSRCDL